MGALFVPRARPGARLRQLQARVSAPAVMAGPPTVTSGTTQTLARRWYAANGSASYRLASSPRGGFFTPTRTQPVANGIALTPGTTLTPGTGGQTATGMMQVSFLHDGSDIELNIYSTNGMLIRVDGEYVSLTPTTVAATSTFIKLAFGSRKLRRIDVIGTQLNFMGVATGWTDGLYPAPVRGPRVICLGDSFTQSDVQGWHSWLSDCTGWDDVWAAGVGGTGYLATAGGAAKKFRDRVASDVIAYAPDIVLVMGSLNDSASTPSALTAEATALVAQIRDALPSCLVIGGYNASGGVEKLTAQGLDAMDATRDGFIAGGGVWLNPIEMPVTFDGAVPATTVAFATAAGRPGCGANPATITPASQGITGQTTISPATNALPFAGGVVEIGTGATRERIHVTTFAQTSGVIAYGFDGTARYAHAVGEPMVMKGPSFLTGQGKAGTPTGFGNADLFISADGVHPTPEGHRAIAHVQATMLRQYLGALS